MSEKEALGEIADLSDDITWGEAMEKIRAAAARHGVSFEALKAKKLGDIGIARSIRHRRRKRSHARAERAR